MVWRKPEAKASKELTREEVVEKEKVCPGRHRAI